MVIDFEGCRDALAEVVQRELLGLPVTVYPRGTSSVIRLPAVAIGMPTWEADVQPCMDRATYPITVAVDRNGSDTSVVTVLEDLWPRVAAALRDAMAADQTLFGTCKAANVTRAEPTALTVQDRELPAVTVTAELYG